MTRRGDTAWRLELPFLRLSALLLLLNLFSVGCKHTISHTSDPHLQKIDEMLSAKLPPGTPRGLVQNFLKSRGYQFEAAPDKDSLRAIVRHIDTDTLTPATARATFHFDSNSNLITFDLRPMPDAPLQP